MFVGVLLVVFESGAMGAVPAPWCPRDEEEDGATP